jgi:hypothetical protein
MAEAPLIIGVHGFKQSGKDTLANLLVEEYGYRRLAFADRVKDAIHIIFGIPKEYLYGSDQDKQRPSGVRWKDLQEVVREKKDDQEVLSIRELLQIFATEICRSKIPSIWYRYLPLPEGERLVVSDLRFENEADFLLSREAHLVKVLRPSVGGTSHESELGLSDERMHQVILNDGSLNVFHERIRSWMNSF